METPSGGGDESHESPPVATGGLFAHSLLGALALPVHRRQEAFQLRQLLDRPHHAEADEVAVGHPPDALRPLRVALQPALVRAAAGGATAAGRVVRPRATPDDVRVLVRRRLA